MNSSIEEIESSVESSSSSEEKVVKRRGRPRKWETQNVKQQNKTNNVLYNSPLGHNYAYSQNNQILFINPLVQRGFVNVHNEVSIPLVRHSSTSYNIAQDDHMVCNTDRAPVYIKPHTKQKKVEGSCYLPERRHKRAASVQRVTNRQQEIVENDEEYVKSEDDDNIEKLLSHNHEKDVYFVKFRYMSYIHCDYVSADEVKKTKSGIIKAKRFRQPEVPFDPDFVKIDRVLHEDYRDGKVYIVKWKKLTYELCTEEKAEDVMKCENFEEELRKYRDRKKMRIMRYALEWRPSREMHVKFEESPTYKGGNKLRAYQLEGLNWLLNRWYYKVSCIMADEMGLGKTVQSVVFVNSLFTKFDYAGPVLVVAPLSTLGHWEREFLNWTDLRVLMYHGSIPGRDMIANYEFFLKTNNSNIRLFDVMITTYEMVMFGFDHVSQFNWAVGIFDEAHRLKNASSRAASTLRNINFSHKVLLSGTPLQNNVKELWSLLNFINPVEFNDCNTFLSVYKLEDSTDVERLQNLLRPLMLRRMKEDVEKTIPMKEETIIEVELTMIQKRYYRAILEKNLDFLTKGTKDSAPNLLNAMMELRKCCIHPFLIKGAEEKIIGDYVKRKQKEQVDAPVVENDDLIVENLQPNVQSIVITKDISTGVDEYYKVLIQSSGKLVLLDKLLNKLYGKHKVLIFSQMTRCLDLLGEYLAYKKYNFERIDGGVRGDLRQSAIDRFSDADSNGFVFLLCTRAGGVGINLTAADTVIIFDSDWNPQNDLQAQARCHRIGQKNEVKIYRLVTRNTYEREMFDKAGMKLGLDRAVLQKMTFEGHKNEKVRKKDAIEILLRKGAYGVLMETDEASKKFCEEDIDQILERRTKVIKHSDGGNAFSKASFQVDEEIDDPDFWDNLLNKKKNEENEGRVKRQMRRIAREDNKEEDLQEIEAYVNMELGSECDVEFFEKQCLKIFFYVLKNGTNALGLVFDKQNLIETQVYNGCKFIDRLLYFKYVMKYCIDQLPNEKIRGDFSYCMEPVLNENYDPSLFEKYKDLYAKYGESCFLRVQAVFILHFLLQTEKLNPEKTRGWNQDDDKALVESTLQNGYGNYVEKIRNKSYEECNQRIRKIISSLNRIKETAETDSVYYKTIMKFGRVTEHNEDNVIRYLEDKDMHGLKENIINIMSTSRRSRSQSDTECNERILFFSRLSDLTKVPVMRRVNIPKGWSKEKDVELKEYLLEKGLVDVETVFGMTEEQCIRRCELLMKNAIQQKEE